MQVQQIPFSWNLEMSQKFDTTGTIVPYELGDLGTTWFPEEYRKGRRRLKFRRLDYDLVWDITEMQVKVSVRAIIPNATGPLITQLAKERQIQAHETTYTGESRSKALERDIDISRAAIARSGEGTPTRKGDDSQATSTGPDGPASNLLVDNSIGQHKQQEDPATASETTPSTRIILHVGLRNSNELPRVSHLQTTRW